MNRCWECDRFEPMETRDEDGGYSDDDMGVCRFNLCITVGDAVECEGWRGSRD